MIMIMISLSCHKHINTQVTLHQTGQDGEKPGGSVLSDQDKDR